MRTTIAAKLWLGLLLLALLLPAQIYSQNNVTTTPSVNSTTVGTSILTTTKSSHNQTTSTTKGSGNSLQSTSVSLFILSFSLLHLYC